jgi:Peptidase family M28
MLRCRWVLICSLIFPLAGCSRPAGRFSTENARAHVEVLAGTIGSRAVGTPESARARQYIIDQLRLYGFDVRVQEIDARRPELGLTAHVANIIAIRAGSERSAIALVSHSDSVPDAPGAADDAFGVAVSLEAARVLAARTNRRHTLMVLVTDGEEAGLMGAAGLTADRETMERLQAYVNVEAVGSAGTALLFETGPGNAWIVKPWARTAPHPRGASYAIEVYRRLPNDTDFSILKRRDVPGLNFAPIGDSYAYHTARDTADRLSDTTLRFSGENVVNTVEALDPLDLSTRAPMSDVTYFDIGQTVAVSWGKAIAWLIAFSALLLGVLAWFKALGASLRLLGLGRWLLQVLWALGGAALVAGSMIGATWALRETRAVYHPWYARPGRLFMLLLCIGTLAGWIAVRLGAWIPRRAHGERHPIVAWSLALPIWIVLCGVGAAFAPSAGFLWSLPLLIAGVGLLAVPVTHVAPVRAISVVVLAIAGTLWLRDTLELMRFMVAVFGRLPIITPVFVYPALMLACGVMIVPPFVAAAAATRPVVGSSIITAVLLTATVVTAALTYIAPAYTNAQPLRRHARVLVEPDASTATYEVAAAEPGLDLEAGAPSGWYRANDATPGSVPWRRLTLPFVFRTTAASPGPPPATVSGFSLTPVAGGTELSMTIVPQTPGLSVVFVLPSGLQPARSNLPGRSVADRWQATFVAVPAEGVTWRASFRKGRDSQLGDARAIVVSHRFPGGSGWQSLPSWLPQDRAVWTMTVGWALAPAAIAPVPPLR